MDSKTITLNSEEIEILSEIFGSLADLDFPISETPEYDALWDKIVSDWFSTTRSYWETGRLDFLFQFVKNISEGL